MKKTILNLGKALAKNDQKLITGGDVPIGPQGPDGPTGGYPGDTCGGHYCYAPSSSFCGTCEEFLALSTECQLRVISHAACYQ